MPENTTFTLEEDISSGALSVVLAGSDLPYGLPRSFPAFNSGGPLGHEVIRLPGRTTPIVQVQQSQNRDLVIKGAFRDHLFIRDGGAAKTFHARGMRDSVEALKVRANPLRITWAGETRIGLLIETDFGEESDSQITYELTFLVLRPTVSTNDAGQRNQQRDTADLTSQLRALIAQRRLEIAALTGPAFAAGAVARITNAIDIADAGLVTALNAAIVLETAPATGIQSAAQRLIAASGHAQSACRSARDLVFGTTAATIAPRGDSTASAAWASAQYNALDSITTMLDKLRTVSASARSRLQRTLRLVVVRPGDTLEEIARNTVGDASRAGEFGVRPDQLFPGLVLRVPDRAA